MSCLKKRMGKKNNYWGRSPQGRSRLQYFVNILREFTIIATYFFIYKEDLLEWLKNFYDYELVGKSPVYIKINDIFGEYKPLPKKKYDMSLRLKEQEEKQKRYAVQRFKEEYGETPVLVREWKAKK